MAFLPTNWAVIPVLAVDNKKCSLENHYLSHTEEKG